MNEDKEARDFKDRTYLIDTLKQNTRDLKSSYKGPDTEDGMNWLNTAGSAELFERLIKVKPTHSNHREILDILDDVSQKYKDKENWSTIQNRSPVINEMHNFIADIMHNGSTNFKDKEALLDALQKSLAFESPGENNLQWTATDAVLATQLRDTLGIAIKSLHTEVINRLKDPQYSYLKNLIDWNDFLGIGPGGKNSLQSVDSNRFLLEAPTLQQSPNFASAARVGHIIGAATFMFETNACQARQEKNSFATASPMHNFPMNP